MQLFKVALMSLTFLFLKASSFTPHIYPIQYIEPKIVRSGSYLDIKQTLEQNGLHASQIHIIYELNNKNEILDLHLNDDLVSKDHFVSYQEGNGKVVKNFTKTDIDMCYYQGKVRNKTQSFVAVSTCDGIRGVVFDGRETYYIEHEANGPKQKHFLIRHSDVEHYKRGFDEGINLMHKINKTELNQTARLKRFANQVELFDVFSANENSLYIELVLVVDNKVSKKFDRNPKKVHEHCKNIVNIVNALYTPLNVFVVLKGVIIWRNRDEISISIDSSKTLNSFAAYRERLHKDHQHDNAFLLTDSVFDDGVVGKALIKTMCSPLGSGGIARDHSNIIAIVATTIAHEMGHNFGMQHDNDDCDCPDHFCCIMSAVSSPVAPTHWSSCSIDQFNEALNDGIGYCLKNKPEKLFDSPTCGNGFLEDGEDCDCGLPEHCNNPCCDPNTCRFNENAVCATGSCCDSTTCKPFSAGKMCRRQTNECDLPEYCNGENEFCPDDVYKRETEECQDGKAFCYQGSCQSHDNQCKMLWGPSTDSFELCYDHNLSGDKNGNCGYDHVYKKYSSCEIDDMLCGRLQCRALKKREYTDTVFRLKDNPMTAKKYHGHSVICHTTVFPGLHPVDPGMTPDGAKCGDDKMCVKQKCLSVETLKVEGKVLECPDCHGNGVCNSNGHCHCDEGWAPPFCNEPGFGGSDDSGPRCSSERNFSLEVVYVMLVGIILSFFLIGVISWYLRRFRFKCCDKMTEFPDFPPPSPYSSTEELDMPFIRSATNSASCKSPSKVNLRDSSAFLFDPSIYKFNKLKITTTPSSSHIVSNPIPYTTVSVKSNNNKYQNIRQAPPPPRSN